eukprot:1257373-Amphidinium_carterae.1
MHHSISMKGIGWAISLLLASFGYGNVQQNSRQVHDSTSLQRYLNLKYEANASSSQYQCSTPVTATIHVSNHSYYVY